MQELGARELAIVAPYWEHRILAKAEILFREGDPADALYYVVGGELVLYKETDDAMPLELARIGKGQFLGELAILEDSFRSGTIQSIKETQLISIKKDDFYELIDKNPKIGVIILRGLARVISLQLRNTTGQFVAIHTG